ncbi:winged helix-turn-helix domain-containing protein [Solirubrobacter taibaiensis]|nr:winged helix-turn-helix domain-containing protein [Solirubrobacter taibaiensis]
MDFLILGTLEVRQDGELVAVRGGKVRALLALLVVHANRPVSAERIAISLWGEDVSATAANRVQVLVSRLRRNLGDSELVITTEAGYCLQADDVDAVRFERSVGEAHVASAHGDHRAAAAQLGAALALWRGPALADFSGEEFAQSAIARLEERRATAIEMRIDADLAIGRHAEVIGELEQRVIEAPLRERAYGQLMLALARSGRQADALAVYGRARSALTDGLGLEPGPELREIERRVLNQEVDVVVETSAAPRVPEPPTPTWGREADLARVAALLEQCRLLTIVGPGGVGKTRVALEAALAHGDADFVSLASVARPDDVAAAIVMTLQLTLSAGETMQAALVRHLRRRPRLVVLDNFEHVLDAAALVVELLDGCPKLRLLLTSREPLDLRVERVLSLRPLTVSDAVDQFAGLLNARDQVLGEHDRVAAEEVCRRVDGLPLAVELAAGRIGLLSVRELAERLRSSLAVLGAGARDAPSRQRTLEATLEWSYQLASGRERAALHELAVFAGGGSLEAALAVTQAPLDVLEALVRKHLAVATSGRIGLLVTVQDFALRRLTDDNGARRRHADYFLRFAEEAAPVFERTASSALSAELDAEIDNFRAALGWLCDAGKPAMALRLGIALRDHWVVGNRAEEGAKWLQLALDALPTDAARPLIAKALCVRARLSVDARTLDQAEALAVESLALRHDDPVGQAESICALAWVRLHAHRVGEAYELAVRAERLARDAGAEQVAIDAMRVRAMMAPTPEEAMRVGRDVLGKLERAGNVRRAAQLSAALAYTALFHGDLRTAQVLSRDAFQAAQVAGDAFAGALARGNAGLAHLLAGRPECAAGDFAYELEVTAETGEVELVEEALTGCAAIAASAGRDREAAQLLGAAHRLPATGGDPVIMRRLDAQYFAPARERLGMTIWVAAEAGLGEHEAIQLALHVAATPGVSPTPADVRRAR